MSKQASSNQVSPQPYQPPPPPQKPPQHFAQIQVYNIPATSNPRHPTAQTVKQKEGWWRRNQKNKPQSNSAGSAALIFISGGMSMTWKLGFLDRYEVLTEHIISSWFIGGIIGAAVGAIACNKIPKKTLVSSASILVMICGILQVSGPESYQAILASRYLNGIALGLVFPMTFVLVGEEVVKPLRGMNAVSVDTVCFSCGIFIQILYSTLWSLPLDEGIAAMQMSGILNIIYGIVALTVGSFCIIESPLSYLMRGDESMALDALRRLQRPSIITYETYELLEEHKLYLAKSRERSLLQNAVYGLPALLKLCFYRSFVALGFSYIANFAFVYSTFAATEGWAAAYIWFAVARWLGPIFIVFTMDFKGRKSPMIIGFFVCTILALSVGGIFNDRFIFLNEDAIRTVKYILIVFQFFASIAMASSSAYLSEAFPLAVKPYYVAIVFITEMLVHIIIISHKDYFSVSGYFFALGSLSLVFLGIAVFVMPETKCLSLQDCLLKFRENNNFRN